MTDTKEWLEKCEETDIPKDVYKYISKGKRFEDLIKDIHDVLYKIVYKGNDKHIISKLKRYLVENILTMTHELEGFLNYANEYNEEKEEMDYEWDSNEGCFYKIEKCINKYYIAVCKFIVDNDVSQLNDCIDSLIKTLEHKSLSYASSVDKKHIKDCCTPYASYTGLINDLTRIQGIIDFCDL